MMTFLATIFCFLAPQAVASDDLDAAFQREVAYLTAERRALMERVEAQRAESARRIATAESEIGGLESRLLGLERQADRTEERLGEMEDRVSDIDARKELIASTVLQAGESLGVDVDEDKTAGEKLAVVFGASQEALRVGRSLRVQSGEWFRPDGVAVQGDVVRLGQIGVWGVGAQASGALIPIDGGHLKLPMDAQGQQTAAAVASGTPVDSATVFLLESFERPITERQAQSLEDYMAGGGVVGWVIAGLGVLGLLLAGIRAVLLWTAGRGTDVSDEVAQTLDVGGVAMARELVAARRNPSQRVLETVLRSSARDRSSLQDVATEAILAELPRLERFGAVILVVAAVAPLLGLLGTVTGMIATFDIITEFGTGDPKMLSGGISEALITTQLGLIVAIPLVLLGNTLKGRAESVETQLERGALQAINRIAIESPPSPSATGLVGTSGAERQVAHA